MLHRKSLLNTKHPSSIRGVSRGVDSDVAVPLMSDICLFVCLFPDLSLGRDESNFT